MGGGILEAENAVVDEMLMKLSVSTGVELFIDSLFSLFLLLIC